nr:zf-HC2 domain-containing protein [Clostridia bacterium]
MKMNCNIAQDLMQAYVEGTLSEDSIKVVEEHVAECKTCRDKLEEIKRINAKLDDMESIPISDKTLEGNEGEAGSFRSFKKWLGLRKLISIILAVVLTFTVCYGIFMYVVEYNSYVPYDDAGIRINAEGDIVIDNFYQFNFTERILADDQGGEKRRIIFIYLSSSIYQRNHQVPGGIRIVGNVNDPGNEYGEDEFLLDDNVTGVYYASKQFVDSPPNKHEWQIPENASDEEIQAILEDIAEGSVLLWEKD